MIFNHCAEAHWCAADGLWVCHGIFGRAVSRTVGGFEVPWFALTIVKNMVWLEIFSALSVCREEENG